MPLGLLERSARVPESGYDLSMATPTRKTIAPVSDIPFVIERRKAVPHEFVLEAIAPLSPKTRPMFGCLAVYVEDKIVLFLRDKATSPADNGVWLATTVEHHESLRLEFPNMRSIHILGKPITRWQVLPADAPDFEEAAAASLRSDSRRRLENR